jgi:hypothetical protein
MKTVFVIEELVNISCTVRHIVAVCESEISVNKWLTAHEGNQLVLLDDGSSAPRYEVTEYKVL